MTEEKKITVSFAPGAFDGFDGTQEELDALIAEITRMAESGEMIEQATPLDPEEAQLFNIDTSPRTLQ